MPHPERDREAPSPEQNLPSHHQTARFPNERSAGSASWAAAYALFARPDCDLSASRFHLDRIWHVLVLGEPPPADLEQHLSAILAAGEPTPLPVEVLQQFQQLRARAIKQAPWVERHYRPGKRLKRQQ
ncbi:MAG: hypothetical protein ACRDJW_01330 [Thermomicrobiales bacterium]